MAISFSDPPINEVVIGKTFESQPGLLVPYFGRFWELVQDEFPNCEHAPPIVDPGAEPPIDVATGVVLPRLWFIGEDRTRLLQLQTDRFYYNWRQTAKAAPYQRFESVYAPYKKYISLLSTFFASQLGTELVTRRCELTYVNLFEKGKEWHDFSDLNKLFKDIRFPQHLVDGSLLRGAVRLEYEMTDKSGKVVVSINQATINNEPVIRVELAASSYALDQAPETEDLWFQRAHHAIVKGFCDLTTEEAQHSYWKRTS
jgi:uncharacterized protein (TIGR04255 family)